MWDLIPVILATIGYTLAGVAFATGLNRKYDCPLLEGGLLLAVLWSMILLWMLVLA